MRSSVTRMVRLGMFVLVLEIAVVISASTPGRFLADLDPDLHLVRLFSLPSQLTAICRSGSAIRLTALGQSAVWIETPRPRVMNR